MVEALKSKYIAAMRGLPIVVGNEVVNWSKESFKRQGFTDASLAPWRKRKGNNKKGKGRALLVQSGRLRRSIRVIRSTGNSVVVGSDVPYARVHNEGFTGIQTVKGHSRKNSQVKSFTRQMNMPKRQFLGNSSLMVERIKRTASIYLTRNLR